MHIICRWSLLSTLLLGSSFSVRQTSTLASISVNLHLRLLCIVCLRLVVTTFRARIWYGDIGDSVTVNSGLQAPASSFTTKVEHFTVHIVQVLLLRSQDGAWSCNPDPADEGCRWETEVFHAIQTNQSACPSKTSLAMNSNRTGFVLRSSKELRDNFIGWGCTIKEVQVQMPDPLLRELVLFVLRLVQADN